MKNLNLYLLILFISYVISPSQAQYVPFPKGKAVWRNYEYPTDGRPQNIPPIWYYQTGEDTLINTISYKRVYKITLQPTGIRDTTYWFAYREDEIKQKIWIVPLGKGEEKMLFDFDLKLGDTFSGWYNEDKSTVAKTFKVVSVMDGMNGRRRFGIDAVETPSNVTVKVELTAGIGFDTGILNLPFFSVEKDVYRTLCFSEGTTLNRCFSLPQAFILSSNSAVENNTQMMTLFPNPASESIHISAAKDYQQFSIYHSTGQKVVEIKATESIDVTILPAGLYLLEAIDVQGRRTLKKFEKR